MAQVDANEVEVCEVEDSAIVGLRTRVLRPQFGPGQLATYAQDKDPTTSHWAARVGGKVVGCATFHLDPSPTAPAEQAIRLRGMAVDPSLQGQGIGAILMRHAMAELAARHTERLLWCNARLRAVSFYERLGFVRWGELFEIEGIGPHYVMWRAL
jgi:GNAT superfamily N-acetyltransferase